MFDSFVCGIVLLVESEIIIFSNISLELVIYFEQLFVYIFHTIVPTMKIFDI